MVTTIEEINKITKKISEINDDINNLRTLFGFHIPIPLKYNNVEIRQSSIHGKGLFATKDIPKDVVITFYPAHALLWNGKFVPNDKDPKLITNRDEISRYYGNYISFTDNMEVIGNPTNTSNKLLLGHMINDASGNVFQDVKFDRTKDLKEFKNLVAEYYIKGLKKKNCRLTTDTNKIITCVVTTREVKKDEEILTYYDPTYWFNLNYGTFNDNMNHALKNTMILMSDTEFAKWVLGYIR